MKGYIEVDLPAEAENLTLHYVKLADDQEVKEYEQAVPVTEGNVAVISELENGLYQIQAFGDSEYEFMPSVVSVPMWNEQEKEMQYDITVIPKYTHHMQVQEIAPQTGDESLGAGYSLLGFISLIIIVIISCHNPFKCGRMSHMYTKRRRT